MKTLYLITRFPEGLHGYIPHMTGQKGNGKIVLIDGDVDGYKQITKEEAETLFPDLKNEG